MTPYFSIIISTLNEELFIGGILDDLVRQEYKLFEVIHVDAKSEDDTCEVVNQYKDKLTIVSIISDRRNLSYQRNLGAQKAKGHYFIFIDADTRIRSNLFLARLNKACHKTKREIYYPKVIYPNNDPSIKAVEVLSNLLSKLAPLLPRPIPTSGLAVFQKEFFELLGGYAISPNHDKKQLFAEDQEIINRASKLGVKGWYLPEISYVFSLRRFEKDGRIRVLFKIVFSTLAQYSGSPIVETDYEMGGHRYHKHI